MHAKTLKTCTVPVYDRLKVRENSLTMRIYEGQNCVTPAPVLCIELSPPNNCIFIIDRDKI